MNSSETLVSVRDLCFDRPQGGALGVDVSFELKRGGAVFVTGPNGSGKSTLLNVILGNFKPSAGSVAVRSRSVGFLSQLHNREFHIPIRLSDVLSFGLKGPLDLARLDALGLLGRAALDLSWNSASGGERQKALITRVLLGEHDLLILDEPMNHLDLETRSHLWKILRNQIEGCGRGIIMVCHDRDPAIGEWADALEVCLT